MQLTPRFLRPRPTLALTLPQVWLGLAIALPVLGALIAPLSATDLAYHLRAGAEILDTGTIPAIDTWTFTAAGTDWVDQQWGAQTAFAAIHGAGGWVGLILLRAALVGIAFGLLAIAIRRRNPGLSERTVGLLVVGAFVVAAPALALRPQLIAIVLFAATLALVAARGRDRRMLLLVPVIVAAWANVHGSFVLGPVLVGLAWLEDVHERAPRAWLTLLAAVVAGVAALVNPLGAAVWVYAAGISLDPTVTARVTEWQPTTLRDVPGMLFWASVAGVAVLLARRRATTPWPALLTLAAFAFLAAYTVRGLAWWPPVAAVVVAGLLPPTPISSRAPQRSVANGLLLLAVVAAGLITTPAWRQADPATGAPRGALTEAPSGITAGLRSIATSGDRVWNPQSWGSWLEFALPDLPVALDSRIELFPPGTWADLDALRGARSGWATVLDRHRVTIVVTQASDDAVLAAALAADAAWHASYADTEGTIWVRADRPSVP